ncbi:MAG: LiaI-LiaF-like domain-containing protein [Acidobacteriota bacterium]
MEHRRPSIIGPLILITAGVLFLLANMGMLPFTFWELAARYWPIVLILIGLEIIFGRRSMLGALVILVLWLGLVGGVIWIAYAQGGGILPIAPSATEEISQPLGDIKSATVDLNVGFSNTTLTALGTDTGDLMKGTYRHSEGVRVVKTYDVAGSDGRLSLKEEGSNFMLGGATASRWDLGLNPGIPIVLRVDGGVGHSSLDLGTLKITSLQIDTGVGSMNVTTPGTGSVTMRLNGGVGSAIVNIPQGVAGRLRVNAGLGSIRVDENRFPKFGDVYQSADFSSAANKIDVEIDGGIGSITVR